MIWWFFIFCKRNGALTWNRTKIRILEESCTIHCAMSAEWLAAKESNLIYADLQSGPDANLYRCQQRWRKATDIIWSFRIESNNRLTVINRLLCHWATEGKCMNFRLNLLQKKLTKNPPVYGRVTIQDEFDQPYLSGLIAFATIFTVSRNISFFLVSNPRRIVERPLGYELVAKTGNAPVISSLWGWRDTFSPLGYYQYSANHL